MMYEFHAILERLGYRKHPNKDIYYKCVGYGRLDLLIGKDEDNNSSENNCLFFMVRIDEDSTTNSSAFHSTLVDIETIDTTYAELDTQNRQKAFIKEMQYREDTILSLSVGSTIISLSDTTKLVP